MALPQTISRDEVKNLINLGKIQGFNERQVIDSLLKRGHTIEGLNINPEEYRQTIEQAQQPAEEPGYFERVKQRYQEGAQDIISGFREGAQQSNEGNVIRGATTMGVRTVGEVAEQAFTPVFEAPGIKQGVEKVGELIAKIPGVSWLLGKVEELRDTNPTLAKDIKNVVDIASLGVGGALERGGAKVVNRAGRAASEGSTAIQRSLEQVGPAIGEVVKPTPTLGKAVGEVIGKAGKGLEKEAQQVVRGLAEISTEGVTTFKDLGGKISSRIKELKNQVDDALAQDTTRRTLDELKIFTATEQGTTAASNPVKQSLEQLRELYQKTGDTGSLVELEDFIKKAETQGITNQEINQLARDYNNIFGDKAFSKTTGDPLTSVNAQMYENTREALKNFARAGIGGEEARLADLAMSNLINVQKLVQKNVQEVNKLTRRIQERGFFEQVGNQLSKYADLLTGGSLRGVVGGLLPRGVGYKTLNAIDLEQSLQRNLKIIQEAIKSNTPKEIEELLKKLNLGESDQQFASVEENEKTKKAFKLPFINTVHAQVIDSLEEPDKVDLTGYIEKLGDLGEKFGRAIGGVQTGEFFARLFSKGKKEAPATTPEEVPTVDSQVMGWVTNQQLKDKIQELENITPLGGINNNPYTVLPINPSGGEIKIGPEEEGKIMVVGAPNKFIEASGDVWFKADGGTGMVIYASSLGSGNVRIGGCDNPRLNPDTGQMECGLIIIR